MIIKNEVLAEKVASAVAEYNGKLRDNDNNPEPVIEYEYVEDTLGIDISEEDLSKLQGLTVDINTRTTNQTDLEEIVSELPSVLDAMKNLKSFRFLVLTKSDNPQIDMSFLEHLNSDVETLLINGVDLSKEDGTNLKKFNNLHFLNLEKCNISNPQIIEDLNSETVISLKGNEIAPEHYQDALRLISSSKGRIDFSGEKLKIISKIFSSKTANLSDYLGLMQTVDFDAIPELTIKVENDLKIKDNEQLVNILNGKTNIKLSSSVEALEKLDSEGKLEIQTEAIIKNASELTVEELSSHKCIKSVRMVDGENTTKQQGEPYTREEYENARSEIDKVLEQIEYPAENDPDREKKIFAQIYKILGKKISYDFNAISENEKNNARLQITSRNLIGGLLEDKCVCAGYADILRNTLACVGIESEYLGRMPDIENGVKYDLNDPAGHAWNLVMLDGKKYWTDLTWDANNIKSDRYPLKYCLKSTKDFGHTEFSRRLEDIIKEPCPESVTDEEQVMLFTGRALDNKSAEERQEDKNICYLSSAIISIAERGLVSSSIKKAASRCTAIMVSKDKGMEVEDNGRS